MRHLRLVVCVWVGTATIAAADAPVRIDQLVREALSEPSRDRPANAEMIVQMLFAFVRTHPGGAATLLETESLVAVTPDRAIGNPVFGSRSEVTLSASFDEPLQHAGSDIVLVHNHPSSGGLSGADLGQLRKPGVFAIVAIGHDGSIYAASAGAAFDGLHFESDTYPAVKNAVVREMQRESPHSRIPLSAFIPYVEHVAAMALHKAQVVRYRARLSDPRRVAYDQVAIACGHIAESVSSRVKVKPR